MGDKTVRKDIDQSIKDWDNDVKWGGNLGGMFGAALGGAIGGAKGARSMKGLPKQFIDEARKAESTLGAFRGAAVGLPVGMATGLQKFHKNHPDRDPWDPASDRKMKK